MTAHLPAWRQSGRFAIEAVVEPAAERARIAASLLPGVRVYPRLEELLAQHQVDFVDICTPPRFHADLALGALEAGLHVFCEKPLSACLDEVRAIRQAAGQARKVVFTVNNWKHAPLWVKARELVRNGAIGAVRSVALNVDRRPNSGGGASDWRQCAEIAQGGILIDHGWHNLYLILALVRERPVSVSAAFERPHGAAGVEEAADLTIRFEKAQARLRLTWQASCRRNSGAVIGAAGTLAVNDDHLLLSARGSGPRRYDFPEALSAGSHHPEWMTSVVADFGREIEDPGCRGTNLAEAQWCARLIDLAYRCGCGHSGPMAVDCPGTEEFHR